MNKHTARWARLGFLALILQGVGCWGDVDIMEGPPPGVGGSSTGGPEVAVGSVLPCEDSDVQCNGSDVERCVTLGSGSGRGWLKIQHCDSAALCNQETASCTNRACNFSELRCNGAVPERCNDDLTARDPLPACAGAAYCSPDAEKCAAENKQAPCCLDTPCKAGELRCNNGEIERCKDDQSGLDSVVTCATQKLCELSIGGCLANPASCQCEPPKCEAGATRCTGAVLERCNADQTDWETVNDCVTEELCQQGLEQPVPACPGVPCQPGEHRCTGADLEVCNAGQTGFELVQTCPGGAAFCDAGNGVCAQTPCSIGQTSCNGAQMVRCRQDQTGFDPVPGALCETARLCELGRSAGVCQRPTCNAGEFHCQDNQPIRCNPEQTDFVSAGPACLRAELCDESRQRCNFCFPGRRECTPDNRSSRTCAPDGNSFGPLTFCPLGCIPSTGACQTCNVGELRCQGGLLSRCNDGVSFTPLNVGATCSGNSQVTCSGNQVQTTPCALGCNAQRSACNQCTAGQRSCADTTSFATCQPNGTFGPAQSCGAGLLCAGQGVCSCTPGQATCSGNTLQVCNDTGTGLVAGARCGGPGGNVLRTCAAGQLTTNTCLSAALCTAATGSTCAAACTEGERTCAAGQPQVCTNGQIVPAAACDPGFACEGAGLCRCAAGDVRCTGGALVQCSADRASFEPAPACSGATLRSCTGATRLPDQACGSAALCAASVGGVCAACQNSDPVSCAGDSEVRCVGGQLQQTACDPILGLSCLDGIGCVADVIPLP
ncbi:MAG TPA: hypothetical protein VFS67_30520 [Polyangiaceae bacterium]|nr:hypothetical protein [Polyangiaceae bacterium]